MKWLYLDITEEPYEVPQNVQAQAYSVAAERPMYDVLTGVLLP